MSDNRTLSFIYRDGRWSQAHLRQGPKNPRRKAAWIRRKYTAEQLTCIEVGLSAFSRLSIDDWHRWHGFCAAIGNLPTSALIRQRTQRASLGGAYISYVPIEYTIERLQRKYRYYHHAGYADFFDPSSTRARDRKGITHAMFKDGDVLATACVQASWEGVGPMTSVPYATSKLTCPTCRMLAV